MYGLYTEQGTTESRLVKEMILIAAAVAIGIAIIGIYILGIRAQRGSDETSVNDKAAGENATADGPSETAEESVLEVDNLSVAGGEGRAADIISYSGNISYEDQLDMYSIEALYDGPCRVEIGEMLYDTRVNISICDEMGNKVASDGYCDSGSGITGSLEAGRTYIVMVEQNKGFTGYELSIGMPKEPVDLTGYGSYSDSITYTDQCNEYYYTAPVDGLYRFELSEMYEGTAVGISVVDRLGNPVAAEWYCKSGKGVEAEELKAGETYCIRINQIKEYTSYNLTLWHPKNKLDISEYTIVNDSVQYEDQCNVYEFRVLQSGDYNFKLSGIYDGCAVCIIMKNYLGETIGSDTHCKNGEGFWVKNLKAGDSYDIYVYQTKGYSDYSLNIKAKLAEATPVSEGINTESTYATACADSGGKNEAFPLDNGNKVDITPSDNEKSVEIVPIDDGKQVEIVQ